MTRPAFPVQVAEWVMTYLGAHVSIQDIWDHSPDGGDGHSPRGFYGLSAISDEARRCCCVVSSCHPASVLTLLAVVVICYLYNTRQWSSPLLHGMA